MPAFPNLSEEELDAVSDYVAEATTP
jgi:mono/diheme cytochrome c family protein